MFNIDVFLWSSLMGTTLRAVPSKSYAFSTNYHACIAIPTWPRCAPPILFWPWPPYNLPEVVFNLDFLCQFLLMGTTLRAAPSQIHAFSTNYHACIAMPTWPRCANMTFVDPGWWVPLYVQHPARAMPFQQIIMHALQCQHDVDVHLLFCFDLDLHITSCRGRV